MKSELNMTNKERERKWEIEDAARTIERYGELTNDKILMEEAKKILEEKKNKIDLVLKKLQNGSN